MRYLQGQCHWRQSLSDRGNNWSIYGRYVGCVHFMPRLCLWELDKGLEVLRFVPKLLLAPIPIKYGSQNTHNFWGDVGLYHQTRGGFDGLGIVSHGELPCWCASSNGLCFGRATQVATCMNS